jgi:hypothetical protein
MIKQKIGNRVYAYNKAESYYDKEKKQPGQRRKYPGRVDPLAGRIVEISRTQTKYISLPESAKSTGTVHSELVSGSRLCITPIKKIDSEINSE